MKKFLSFAIIGSLIFADTAFAQEVLQSTSGTVQAPTTVDVQLETSDTTRLPSVEPLETPSVEPDIPAPDVTTPALIQPETVLPEIEIPEEILEERRAEEQLEVDPQDQIEHEEDDKPSEDEEQPNGLVAGDQEPPPNKPFVPRDPNAPVRPKVFTISNRDFIEQSFVNLFSGAANVQLPLHVPNGINGLTPDLTLAYNSQLVNENGPYGFGWEVELGQIKRLNKNGIDKMYDEPVYHITLGSLNGEMIKLGEKDGIAEYALRREQGFAKILHNINNNNWEVKTKDGMLYKLGNSGQSKVVDATGNKIFAWYLEEVVDNNANKISYEYARIENTLYPKKIKYGAGGGSTNNPFEIRFQPFADNDNPSSNRSDIRSDYNKGFKTEYAHLVDKIEVYFQNDKKLTYDLGYAGREYKERSDLNELKVIGKSPDDGKETSQTIKFTYFDVEDGFKTAQLYQRHKYLRSIKFHQGGQILYDYTSSKNFFDNAGQMANKHPFFPVYVVNSVTRQDDYGLSSSTNYFYSDGHFFFDSPAEREVAGFGRVTVTDAEDQKSKYYFHQGGGFDGSTLGENPDDNWSLIGKLYRSEVYNKSSQIVQKSVTRWLTKNLSDKRNFIYQASSVNTVLDGPAPLSTAEEAVYDFNNGNVLSGTSFGEVTGTDNGFFTDAGTDKRKTVATYAQNQEKYLLSFVASEKIYDQSDNLLQQNSYLYDNLASGQVNKGNLSQQNQHLFNPNKEISSKYIYNNYGQITKVTDPLNHNVEMVYDNLSLYPAKIINHLGHTVNFEYEYIFGGIKKTTDPNGVISQSKFDGLGRQVEGLFSSLEDKNKLVTLAKITYQESAYPNSVETEVFFENNLSSKQRTYLDGFARVIQQKSQSENADAFVTVDFQYNKLGQKEKEVLPYFSNTIANTPISTDQKLFTTLSYDVLGRAISVKNNLGTATNTYKGREVTVTDLSGKIKIFLSDAYQNLVKVKEINGVETYETTYSYSPLNQLTQLKDAKGNVRNFSYDAVGRLTKQEDLHAQADATFGVWTYEYDDGGNLIKLIKPEGQTIQYVYDDLNRLKSEDFTAEAGVELSYGYDAAKNAIGKLVSVKKKDFEAFYNYDNRGNLLVEQKTVDGQNYATTYSYDLQNRLRESTLPDGSVVKNFYNPAGQVEKVQKKESGAADFTDVIKNYDYSPLGQVTKVEYGNGAVTNNTYDTGQLYRLTQKISTLNGKKLQDISYSFDAVGNITKIVDSSQGQVTQKTLLPKGDVNGDEVINVSDSLCAGLIAVWYKNGLKRALIPKCIVSASKYLLADADCNKKVDSMDVAIINRIALGALPKSVDKDQDLIHNKCEPQDPIIKTTNLSTAKTAEYKYDGLHRLTEAKITGAAYGDNYTQTFKYDALGNMTYNSTLGDMSYGASTESAYANPHAVNKITSALNGEKKITYNKNGEILNDGNQTLAWDYNGRLLSSNKGGVVTTFSYDHSGQRTKKNNDKYLWGNYEVEASGKIIKHIAEATVETANGVTAAYYSLDDHLSSASVLLDHTGEIAQILDYYPYGASRLDKQFGSFDEKKKFTGHELDDETGLYYANARYYNPAIGRFYSLDPAALGDFMKFLDDPQQLNFYAYARNNPMKYVDPSGTFSLMIVPANAEVNLGTGSYGESGNEVNSGAFSSGWNIYTNTSNNYIKSSLSTLDKVAGLIIGGAATGGSGPVSKALGEVKSVFNAVEKIKEKPSKNEVYEVRQPKMSTRFSDKEGFRYANRSVKEAIEDLKNGRTHPEELPVGYVQVNEHNVIINNRTFSAVKESGLTPVFKPIMESSAYKFATELLKQSKGHIFDTFVKKP